MSPSCSEFSPGSQNYDDCSGLHSSLPRPAYQPCSHYAGHIYSATATAATTTTESVTQVESDCDYSPSPTITKFSAGPRHLGQHRYSRATGHENSSVNTFNGRDPTTSTILGTSRRGLLNAYDHPVLKSAYPSATTTLEHINSEVDTTNFPFEPGDMHQGQNLSINGFAMPSGWRSHNRFRCRPWHKTHDAWSRRSEVIFYPHCLG